MKPLYEHTTVGDIWEWTDARGDESFRVLIMCLCGWSYDSKWRRVTRASLAFEIEDRVSQHVARPYDDAADGRK